MSIQQQMPDAAKHAVDVISLGVVVGTIVQWLPAVAALFTIIWTAIRIYETPTVQRLLGRK
jgi:hypothetical protein